MLYIYSPEGTEDLIERDHRFLWVIGLVDRVGWGGFSGLVAWEINLIGVARGGRRCARLGRAGAGERAESSGAGRGGRQRSGEGRGHRAERQHRRWYCTAVYCGRVGSRHFQKLEEKYPSSLVFMWRLYQDVFVFVCAGEEGLGIGADRDDSAVVGTRKIHGGKNHLAGNSFALKAFKDAGVLNDHPLGSGALVRHFADLHRFGTGAFFGGLHPCLENAAFLGLLVLNSYHSCFVLAVIYVTISLALRMF